MATREDIRLSFEANLPSFAGATQWLNSEPLTPADLRGHVVLVDFWTFTCINWIRTAPYRRAWDERYRERGLIVIGVHTPEFPFERDVDGIRAAIDARRIAYPVAVDSDYAVWSAFANRYWPALYVADANGAIRFHHFGEGRYLESEAAIKALLHVPDRPEEDFVDVVGEGIEAAADSTTVRSPETYLGYERGERFASQGRAALAVRHAYSTPSPLTLNRWALSGDWTIDRKAARAHEADGRLAFRFSARDLNLVMGPAEGNEPVRFRVRLDGAPPAESRGGDVDEGGNGTATDRRLYQLVRQRGAVDERTFEITFLDPGAEAYVFTFG
jgi:thiol-disulfide isomerase/thioredoxin